MILDVDIGNTRLKWRLASAEQVVRRGSFVHRSGNWSELEALTAYIPTRVRVANVGGSVLGEQLESIVSCCFGLTPEFAVSSDRVGVVQSGYVNPRLLGVDRWLAILAAWNCLASECLVVDAGSALTVDLVDSQGVHQGGYIVPGWQMMLDALYGGTSGVRAETVKLNQLGYGSTTDEAVQHGVIKMMLSLIREEARSGRECGGDGAVIVLTGGDAEMLRAFLPESTVCAPELVLDGLALALP